VTDWLPWGFALMVGIVATQALTLRALAKAPLGQRPDLRPAGWALAATALVSGALYLLYVLFGECWLPYVRCR